MKYLYIQMICAYLCRVINQSTLKTSESRYGQCMYFASNALARKTEKLAIAAWRKADLPPSHAYLLMIVLDEPGVQPGALSSELHLTPSTVTRLIEKLEEKKLVTRVTEGKTTAVYPTAKSRELKPLLLECVEDFSKSCTALLGRDECTRFVNNITKIADRISS